MYYVDLLVVSNNTSPEAKCEVVIVERDMVVSLYSGGHLSYDSKSQNTLLRRLGQRDLVTPTRGMSFPITIKVSVNGILMETMRYDEGRVLLQVTDEMIGFMPHVLPIHPIHKIHQHNELRPHMLHPAHSDHDLIRPVHSKIVTHKNDNEPRRHDLIRKLAPIEHERPVVHDDHMAHGYEPKHIDMYRRHMHDAVEKRMNHIISHRDHVEELHNNNYVANMDIHKIGINHDGTIIQGRHADIPNHLDTLLRTRQVVDPDRYSHEEHISHIGINKDGTLRVGQHRNLPSGQIVYHPKSTYVVDNTHKSDDNMAVHTAISDHAFKRANREYTITHGGDRYETRRLNPH